MVEITRRNKQQAMYARLSRNAARSGDLVTAAFYATLAEPNVFDSVQVRRIECPSPEREQQPISVRTS